ncbi:MAG: DUF3883 domain-containing protein [Anaerolineales bacterium]|nr:DUF3883 domain-containing protein [Anaerolineales bacterium]
MKPENELAMIVAYYLSKFGEEGLEKLGYRSYRQAFIQIGHILNVKPNSIKNWRDEFDPNYDNERKGWYQRDIRPSRRKVILAFDDLSEDALRVVVQDIIMPEARQSIKDELVATLEEIKNIDKKKKQRKSIEYIPRGVTGRMAEDFFIYRFNAGLTPFVGLLKDCRDEGVGFDFEIIRDKSRACIEIKGLAKQSGGISFTDKEWKVASTIQSNYFLGLVNQVFESPRIGFVQNPAHFFTPVYYAYTTVSVNWAINEDQISSIELS